MKSISKEVDFFCFRLASVVEEVLLKNIELSGSLVIRMLTAEYLF